MRKTGHVDYLIEFVQKGRFLNKREIQKKANVTLKSGTNGQDKNKI